jgi:putative selenium metabolism hydrolase
MDKKDTVRQILIRDREKMISYLRDIIAMPSPSGGEGAVAARTVKEMEQCGFDKAYIDGIGNAIGVIGSGKPAVLFDAHMDTVGTHEQKLWAHNPYTGKFDGEYVFGRGAAENKGALAAIIYGIKAMREANLLRGTVYVTGSVFEEDCDGLGLWYALAKTGLKPDCVVVGKFTELKIMRGQRGRMEIKITVAGKSCHASTPDDGVNPIYRAVPIIAGIEKLNNELKGDSFLGKGTVAVTQISVKSPGFNRLAHEAYLSIDRRLTVGETKERAIQQIERLPGAKDAQVEVLTYEKPAHTGLVQKVEKYFPGWSVSEDSNIVKAAVKAYGTAIGGMPVIDKWTVSSNGVSSCGLLGIPTIGFGPGEKRYIHNYDDRIAVEDMLKAASFYALFPDIYAAL